MRGAEARADALENPRQLLQSSAGASSRSPAQSNLQLSAFLPTSVLVPPIRALNLKASPTPGPCGLHAPPTPIQHQLGPLLCILQCRHVDAHAEAVQQLWPQLAFRGIAGPDHNEFCGVHNGHTLTLHCVEAAGGRVQHHVYQAVVEQVDLIHVEDAAVGLGL